MEVHARVLSWDSSRLGVYVQDLPINELDCTVVHRGPKTSGWDVLFI